MGDTVTAERELVYSLLGAKGGGKKAEKAAKKTLDDALKGLGKIEKAGAKYDKAVAKQDKKEAKQNQKQAIRTSKDLPVYEDKAKPEVDAAIGELETLPGAHDALEQLMSLRLNAATQAEAGQFTEAVATLKPVKSILEGGKKAAAAAEQAAKKAFATVIKDADALRTRIGKDGAALSERARKDMLAEVDVVVGPLYLPGASGGDAAFVSDSLAALATGFQDQIKAADQAKTQAESGLADARVLLGELKACVTTAEYARMVVLVDSAQTLFSEREYGDAKHAVDEVLASGGGSRDAAVAARMEWETRAAKLPGYVATAAKLAKQANVPTLHEISPTAQEVRDGLEELASQKPPEVVSYAQAATTYDLLTAQLGDLAHRIKRDAAFQPLREQAHHRVLSATEDVTTALDALHERVTSFFPDRAEDDLDGPFVAASEAAEAEWTDGMRRVTDDKALLELAASVVAKLAAIVERIGQTATDVGAFTDALGGRDVEIARAAFEAARRSCAAAIDELVAVNVPAGIAQAELLSAITDRAAKAQSVDALQAQAKRAGTLAAKTTKQLQRDAKDSEAAKTAVTDLLTQAEAKLKTFTDLIAEKSKLDWIREPTKERDYGGMRDHFKEQLDEQRPLAKMSEAGILDECNGELTALCGYLDSAITAVKGGKDAKELNVGTVASMDKEIDKLRTRLNKHDVGKYATEQQLQVQEELETLAGEVKSLPLEKARMAVDSLAKDVANVELAAATARKNYKEFEKTTAPLSKLLNDKAFNDAKDYKVVLELKLKKCLGDALAGGLAEAKAELVKIDAEIKAAASDPQARKGGQDSAAEDKRKAEVAAAEWKSRYGIVMDAIKKNTTMLTKERAELTKLAESADKAYKRTQDMQAATMQLRIVNDRLEFLQKYPDGMEVAARNKLPQLRDRWKQSVGDLKTGLDRLTGTITKLAPGEIPPNAAKAVAAAIAGVKNLFDPVLFDAAVDQLNSKKLPKPKLSAIREQALRAVHRAQAIIEKDPRMADLARNPFEKGIDRLIANASLALAEFETNLMISL